MEHDHLIFFVYTILNTVSRVVARQVSVRLERRMYAQGAQGSAGGGEGQNENDVNDLDEEVQDEAQEI